jgi:hypothetical protein
VIIGVGLQLVEKAFNAVEDPNPPSPASSSSKKRKLTASRDSDLDGLSFGRKLLGKAVAKGIGYSGSCQEDVRNTDCMSSPPSAPVKSPPKPT